MQDEIFGPILPIISFENLDDVIRKIKEKESLKKQWKFMLHLQTEWACIELEMS